MVERGEVWLVTLDPTIGSEIRKTRPCLVVSPDELNRKLRTCLVVPMTTGSHPAVFRPVANFDGRPGLLVAEQIRTCDRDRLVKRLGRVDDPTLNAALAVLRELFTV